MPAGKPSMILGHIDSTSIPSLSTPAGAIQRVTTFKLLGLHLDAGLSWMIHINTILSKASKRLYFLEQLRRAGVPPQQLLHFYTAVICPALEYASPVWHYSITRAQSQHLKSIQKRAVHIMFSFTRGMSYPNVLFVANLNSLKDRRDKFFAEPFSKTCKPASCLRHLLPPPRNTSVISRLRSSTPLPRPTSRTRKFESFVNFALK